MFYKFTPWKNAETRLLYHAAFHADEETARQASMKWFADNDLNDVSYDEHRLLAHTRLRFPDEIDALDEAPRLKGLQRQLWIRGQMNLQAAQSVFASLNKMSVPWVLLGSASWFVQPSAPFRSETDIIELTIPDDAWKSVERTLFDIGWEHYWGSPNRAIGPRFHGFSMGKTGKLRITKIDNVFSGLNKGSSHVGQLLSQRNAVNFEGQSYFVPDAETAQKIALSRAHPAFRPSDQWLFDLANMGHGLGATVDAKHKRALERFLRREFELAL